MSLFIKFPRVLQCVLMSSVVYLCCTVNGYTQSVSPLLYRKYPASIVAKLVNWSEYIPLDMTMMDWLAIRIQHNDSLILDYVGKVPSNIQLQWYTDSLQWQLESDILPVLQPKERKVLEYKRSELEYRAPVFMGKVYKDVYYKGRLWAALINSEKLQLSKEQSSSLLSAAKEEYKREKLYSFHGDSVVMDKEQYETKQLLNVLTNEQYCAFKGIELVSNARVLAGTDYRTLLNAGLVKDKKETLERIFHFYYNKQVISGWMDIDENQYYRLNRQLTSQRPSVVIAAMLLQNGYSLKIASHADVMINPELNSQCALALKFMDSLHLKEEQIIALAQMTSELRREADECAAKPDSVLFDKGAFESVRIPHILSEKQYSALLVIKNKEQSIKNAEGDWHRLNRMHLAEGLIKDTAILQMAAYKLFSACIKDRFAHDRESRARMYKMLDRKKPEALLRFDRQSALGTKTISKDAW